MTTTAPLARPTVLLALLALWGCGGDPPPPAPRPDARADAAVVPSAPGDAATAASPDAGVDRPPAADARADAGAEVAPPDTGPAVFALTGLTPLSAPRGTAVKLQVGGAAFLPGAVVLFDGQPLATTFVSAVSLTAELPADRAMQAGFSPVVVQNGAEASAAKSNASYFLVQPPEGWPEVLEYQPDNGVPGDTIRIVGFNLSDRSVRITDPTGRMGQPGRIGTVSGTNVVLESLELTLPPDWRSGPITVSNALGAFRARTFNLGRNLAVMPGAEATASSEYGEGWTIARGKDNDLYTSWFPQAGDCISAGPATCSQVPFYQIAFPTPQTVGRIALRGNREYTTGYDFLRARFDVLGAGGAVLWSGSYELPEPDRDLDITLPTPVPDATAVRFTSERDESEDPGFGELEIFGP